MMNIFTGSPLLLSLMSTVASLPFFLFTLPAGALADRVDRQKAGLHDQRLHGRHSLRFSGAWLDASS
jgi:hypothetical protein